MRRRTDIDAMTVDQLRRHIRLQLHHSGLGLQVNLNSRGRKYTFYWHRKGQCLRVKIGEAARIARPNVEALAAELLTVRVCPECGKAFPRNGKQLFCSRQHAAKLRKRRFRRHQQEKANRAAWVQEQEHVKRILAEDRFHPRRKRRGRLTIAEKALWSSRTR